MLTFGMGGSAASGNSCTVIDLKWAFKVKKIKFIMKKVVVDSKIKICSAT